MQGGIVGQGLGLGLGGLGDGLVTGDGDDGRIGGLLGHGGGILPRLRGLTRFVGLRGGGGLPVGLSGGGIAVLVGLGGAAYAHRGVGGTGLLGSPVTGGKEGRQKSQHQKHGRQPETELIVFQKFHKRHLRFQECVAVYL